MTLAAGRLRHRVTIQEQVTIVINPDTGEKGKVWQDVATVWAAIEPLSAREFIASQQMDSEISARVVIRYRAGLNAAMRIVHVKSGEPVYYNPKDFLSDPDSGLEYLTIPCSTGLNNG